MKKTILIIIVFCSFIYIQCRKSDQLNIKNIEYLHLSEEDLSICPYIGNEKIVFKDSIGDSIVYNGGSRTLNTDQMNCDRTPDYGSNAALCYKYDLSETTFSNHTFFIQLRPLHLFSTNSNTKIFSIQIGTPDIGCFSGNCLYDHGKLYTSHSYPDSIYSDLNVDYYDSIKIVNKQFYSVYKLTGSYWCCMPIKDTIKTLYYSPTKGVVGFWSAKCKNWYLDN